LFHEKVKVSWTEVDGEDKVELYMKESNE
jgi:hypothetical protein